MTFDDGDKVQYTRFYPLLREYGLRATFYVITSQIGRVGKLNRKDLKDLYQDGNEIGSHTHSHPHLTKLTDEEIDFELKESLNLLSPFECKTLAYPYGLYDQRVINFAKKYYSAARGYYDITVNSRDCGYNIACAHDLLDEKYKLMVFPMDHKFLSQNEALFELPFPRFEKAIKKIVEKPVKQRAWGIFVFHGLFKTALKNVLWSTYKGYYAVAINSIKNLSIRGDKLLKFKWICEYLSNNKDIEILTVSEAVSKCFDLSC